jgi:NAD(P) transhydrogenase
MELVHIGQAVMGLGGTLDYFVEGVFNYPTLAECYKVAALDGFNKVRELASAGVDSPGSTAGAQPNEEPTPLGAKGLGELTAVSAHRARSGERRY